MLEGVRTGVGLGFLMSNNNKDEGEKRSLWNMLFGGDSNDQQGCCSHACGNGNGNGCGAHTGQARCGNNCSNPDCNNHNTCCGGCGNTGNCGAGPAQK